ncbi:SRPBCC family protein [Clavibacter sp. Sh2088]|uniref:SRPBCC family protein n=1 Tax=Clavibacter sp. Sh2088 TaxID=3397676 RepID=UPI0039E156BA
MTTLTSSVHIEAPAHVVWHALTDLERYPEWDPYYRSASGVVAVGGTILPDATLDEGFGKPDAAPSESSPRPPARSSGGRAASSCPGSWTPITGPRSPGPAPPARP